MHHIRKLDLPYRLHSQPLSVMFVIFIHWVNSSMSTGTVCTSFVSHLVQWMRYGSCSLNICWCDKQYLLCTLDMQRGKMWYLSSSSFQSHRKELHTDNSIWSLMCYVEDKNSTVEFHDTRDQFEQEYICGFM